MCADLAFPLVKVVHSSYCRAGLGFRSVTPDLTSRLVLTWGDTFGRPWGVTPQYYKHIARMLRI